MDDNLCNGHEKVDTCEKSIIDENNELKKQILSLQKSLDDKDKKIKSLEARLNSQLANLNNAFTQVKCFW